MSFSPLGAERPSEFFVKISDDREVINVVGLLCGSKIFADNKGDTVESHFTVH
jgi:hypothetical protein